MPVPRIRPAEEGKIHMPTYEYRCHKGHEFEREQRITDKPVKKCPECGAECRRLISRSNFILRGSGWYLDGYSPSGEKNKK